MSLHSTFPGTWLLGLSLLIVPRATFGQAPASDSTAVKSDSQPALTDSVQTTGASPAYSDTVLQRAHPDSVSKTDSTRAASDTVHPPASTRPTAPSDSILSAACSGPAGPATVARDLLVVVFSPEASAAERAAAAKSVHGTLLGRVTSGEPGAYYLRVPSGGGGEEYRLRAAADRLIQLDKVRQVGSRACPPLPQRSGSS
jgi:hypothetical protein